MISRRRLVRASAVSPGVLTARAPEPVSSAAIGSEAERFEAAPGVPAVFMGRPAWADAPRPVTIAIDSTPGRMTVHPMHQRRDENKNLVAGSRVDVPTVDTAQESLAVRRLPVGSRRQAFTWPEVSAAVDVTGAAGEVLFVEVINSVRARGDTDRLECGDAVESRRRATPPRFVADVA